MRSRVGVVVLLGLLAAVTSRASVLTYERNTFDVGGNGNLVVSPDGGTLYADTVRDGLLGGPAMAVYGRAADGTIARIQTVFEGEEFGMGSLCGAGKIDVTPDGRHVYVATNCAQTVRSFARDASGMLTSLPPPVHFEGRVDALQGAKDIAISPDGTDVYVAGGYTGGEVATFRRDAVSGRLEWRAGMLVGDLRSALETMVMSPDGTSLYVTDHPLEGDPAIHVLHRDPSTGEITFLESKRDGADGFVTLTRFFSLAVSPDGRNVYAGQIYDEPVIVSFDRQATGALRATNADVGPDVSTSQSLAITGDGRLVFVGGTSGLRIFERAPADGRLALVETVTSVEVPFGTCSLATSVTIDPSDTNVYVGSNDCGILTFRRTCGDGTLDPREACDDGNRHDGDGCDALCRMERCFTCTGSPSACTPDDGIPCDDENACTGDGHCLAGQCVGGTPIDDGTPCDDRDACSVRERCVAGTCLPGTATTCGLCEACDRRFGCVGATRAGCSSSPLYASGNGAIDLRMPADGRRKITWHWGGLDYTMAPLGDPRATTGYTFCAIDTPFELPRGVRRGRVLAAARIPAASRCGRGPCWHEPERGGLLYSDDAGRNDGVRRVLIKPRPRGFTRVSFAAGPHADLRRLPPEGNVTAQLTNDAGGCWSTTYVQYAPRTARRFHVHAGCGDCNGF